MHKKNIKRLTVSAVLSALAIVVVFINFSIFPQVPYLKYDMGDVPILIISFLFGPLYGFLSTVIVAAFQALFLSSDGWYGGFMHIVSTSALILPPAILYFRKRTFKSAIIGLSISCATVTFVMICFNYFLNPVFYGIPRQAIVAVLPWTAAFNFIKTVINSIITIVVYKNISKLIKKFD